jgi:glycosyltransferase involved in cell wall biosynthesis
MQNSSVTPLVSILIPAYNAEEWIADAIQSAIAQTWDCKEIIVVDDGSTDQTLAVARKFEENGVRVFTQQNQGAAAARNLAFTLSQGDFIQWLDADDLLAPDKIVKQMEALEKSGTRKTVLSSAWGQFSYRHCRAKFIPTALWCDLSAVEWLLRKVGQNLYMQTASWLVSRELTEAAGPWDTRLLVDDDGEYFCRVLLASDGVRFVPESRVYYRETGTGRLSNLSKSPQKLDAQWLSMQLHIGYLRSIEDSPRVRAACLEYIQGVLSFFYPERDDIVKQMEQMAEELGGRLAPPQLPWKYSWIRAILGWSVAKRVQHGLPSIKWRMLRSWDKVLFHFEHRRSAH